MDNLTSAEELFAKITVGRQHAVKRPGNSAVDRRFRELVEKARLEGKVIVNDNEGYFVPDFNDPADVIAYRRYIAKEKSRISKIAKKIRIMEKAAEHAISNQLYFKDITKI